jgi:hypothetical protein
MFLKPTAAWHENQPVHRENQHRKISKTNTEEAFYRFTQLRHNGAAGISSELFSRHLLVLFLARAGSAG